MENILLKPLKKRFIPLSSDENENEPIYQPFKGKNNLEVPRSHFGRSISLSPIPQSPLRSPIEDNESPYLHSAPPSRNESRINKARTRHLDWCEEEDCDICEYLLNRQKSKNFFPSSDDLVASRRSKSVDPKRQKPRYAKKLGQLRAAMKIVAAKVNENVWEERYLEAEEFQIVMIWLRSVNGKLQKMLVLRDKRHEKYDYKAAQKAKEEYKAELNDSIDLSRIQHFLSPTEYSILLSLKK
uniref:Uncharacterized protein n=1 Tax=Panagrolaimus sp. PS1159 TaxID=55785 RepID=A0AC35GCM3_9BILA